MTGNKSGDDLNIKIEGAGKAKTITLDNAGGNISIFRDGDGMAFRTIPGEPRVFLDQHFERMSPKAQTWFVCPNDHTMLRVPDDDL